MKNDFYCKTLNLQKIGKFLRSSPYARFLSIISVSAIVTSTTIFCVETIVDLGDEEHTIIDKGRAETFGNQLW